MKPELKDILGITKANLLANIAAVNMVSNISHAETEGTFITNMFNVCHPAMIESMHEGNSSDGFKLPDELTSLNGFFKMFQEMLTKLAVEFPIKTLRSIAHTTDPAYRDMKKKVDLCKLSGLKWRNMDYMSGTRTLEYGVLKREKKYVPVNVGFPIDFYTSFVPFPPYIINFKQFKSSLEKMGNTVINAGVLPPAAALVQDLSCLGGGKQNAYGSFITPLGALALGIGELEGDKANSTVSGCAVSDTDPSASPVDCGDPYSGATGEAITPSSNNPCDEEPKAESENTSEKVDKSC